MKTRIRKSGLQGLYLSREGKWTTWHGAAKFSSDDAAERFAEKHGVTGYGLFSSPCFMDGYTPSVATGVIPPSIETRRKRAKRDGKRVVV